MNNDPNRTAASRHSVGRDMQRTSTAVGFVLFIVLVLALVVVLLGARASLNLRRAEQAEAASLERLWNAHLAEARAVRVSGEAGRRQTALDAINNAAALRSSPALRSEAIATLALSDLIQQGDLLPTPRDLMGRAVDAQMKYCAYGMTNGDVIVRELPAGKTSFTLSAHDLGQENHPAIASLSFSPDAKKIAARFLEGSFAVWDLETRQPIRGMLAPAPPKAFSGIFFSPDSQQIRFSDVAAGGKISTMEIATGRKTTGTIVVGKRLFKLRPDGKQIAVLTDEKVDLLDVDSGKNLKTLSHPSLASMVMWSSDGAALAVSCDDGDIFIWDVERGSRQILRGHTERSVSMEFSPDGRLFYSSSRDEMTRVWDLTQGQTIAIGEGTALTFSPDGNRLGFWRAWLGFGIWRVSQSANFRLLACLKSEGPLFTLDLSPHGRWCVATQAKGFRLWDLAHGEKEFYFPLTQFYSARISSDEKSLFICRLSGLEVWELPTDSTSAPQKVKNIPLPGGIGSRAISMSMDGKTVAVELTDRRLVVVDLAGQHEPVVIKERWRGQNYKGPGGPTGVGRFAMSPDGRWIATGFGFGLHDEPAVWEASSGNRVGEFKAETSLVGFSPDGRWLALAGRDEYSIWSVGDWKLKYKFPRDEATITHGTLAFNENGEMVAVARTRRQVQLRAAFSDEKFADLSGPTPQSINAVRMTPDGSTLVTATANDMVEVWRLDKMRRDLAAMNLDWSGGKNFVATTKPVSSVSWFETNAALIFGLSAFGVVAVLSLLTLRRHRTAIERFFTAEAEAARRNRELEVAKVELMHSQKMQALGTLAAGIAHDFNNLLSIIRMANKFIGRRTKEITEVQKDVGDIEQAVLQGKHIVGSMLGYARTEDGKNEPTDICAVVENAVSLLSKEFLSGLTLTLELDRNASLVPVGRGQLEQVLLNLIVNASEAMEGKGKLKITVQNSSTLPEKPFVLRPASANRFVKMCVIDSGPGIPAEVRERAFEPFFTTKQTATKVGTGLGLSLVYSIAQREELGLSVESEPGKGATFTLVIPVK